MNIKNEVGKRLKEARRLAGYTQKEIASKMLMTQQQYSRFENGVLNLIMNKLYFYVSFTTYRLTIF